MPVGDKNFNDLVEYTEELILACDVGYWRDTWSAATDKMNKLYIGMCRKFKTSVGWRNVCGKDCPFLIAEDTTHVCCISRDWYKGHLFSNVYRMSGGGRVLNPTYHDLTHCKGVKEDLQIFLNELLAGYWEKERVAKPPGTSASKTTYTIATRSEAVVGANSTSTTVVTSPGTYDTNTILGASASTTTPEPDDDDDDDAEDEDGDDEPEHIWHCDYCGAEFNDESDYDDHLDHNHPWCDACEQRFTDIAAFTEHERTEHPDEPNLNCSFCGQEFGTEPDLQRHLVLVHTTTERAAARARAAHDILAGNQQAVGDQVGLQGLLDNAAREVGGVVEVNAPIRLTPGAVLNGHEPAEIRGVAFGQARPTRRSARTPPVHTFDCNVCGEQFFNERSLRGHILLDHPTATYRCDDCGSVFETAALLGTHIGRVHRG
jgi:uncharacterized C2H2 Zn-finger protein